MSDQDIEVERVYTVPLSRAWITARHKRTKRAVNILREFAVHHMKSSEIKIDTELNEELWKRGITKPPRRITVKMEKDEDGLVTISLPKEAKRKLEPVLPEAKSESGNLPPKETAPATTPIATSPAQPAPPAPKSTGSTAKTPPKKRAKKSDH
jgi:large subunit ribosomal protein L31e